MAQVTHDPQHVAKIDRYLAYLIGEWQSVPMLVQGSDDWDEHSRFSLIMDWPIREDRLQQPQKWMEQGQLLPRPHERYVVLQQLVHRYRPLLEDVFTEKHSVSRLSCGIVYTETEEQCGLK